MSHIGPFARDTPRWSTLAKPPAVSAGHGFGPPAGGILSSAELVAPIARVSVGPPLSCSGPSWGSPVRKPAPQVASPKLMFCPGVLSVTVVEQFTPGVFEARIDLETL